jgi:enoyl-CoA hydratase/carnithine racemase
MPPEAALDRLGGGSDPEGAGVLVSGPILAVDLDGGPVPPRLAALARSLPSVVVGISNADPPPADPPDIDVLMTSAPDAPAPWISVGDPTGALSGLADAVDRSPAASVILVQVLRLSAGLGTIDGLAAESLAYSLLQTGPVHRAWLAGRPPPRPAPSTPEVVHVERDGERLIIELNRPERHNAYSRAVRDELAAALQLAATDPSLARVELSGRGPSFSSGGDLNEFGLSDDPVLAHLIRTTRSPAALLARVADRTTAFVHGSCVGAGVELPAFAGHVVADAATTFRLPEVAMGLIPGAGGTVSVPRRVGRCRTAYLALTGEAMDARTALDWGLVDEIDEVRGSG